MRRRGHEETGARNKEKKYSGHARNEEPVKNCAQPPSDFTVTQYPDVGYS